MSSAAFPSVSSRRAAAPRLLGAALLTACLGAASWSASAAVSARAEANIDWSSLTITSIGDISLVFDPVEAGTQFAYTSIDNTNGFNIESSFDWNVGTRIRLESFGGGTLMTNFGYTPPAGPSAEEQTQLHAESSLVLAPFDYRYAGTFVSQGGEFTVQGDGVLLFSVNYSLSLLTEGNDFFSNAYGRATAGASVSKFDGDTLVVNDGSASLESQFDPFGGFFYLDADLDSADRLVVAMAFHDGERGSFRVSSDAYVEGYSEDFAPVPLPASGWLMALPLTMMALRRRPVARLA
ncbi:MAG: hypothetical protein K2Y51_19815 [Gammaproteobacteria bacterium]|nr:hypothetical protein [Gammaproteobacteria bacterium]